jgi:hypothetical protein
MPGRLLEAAAADEVDYFEPVAVLEQRICPAIAGGNGAVEFDCHAVRLHAQGFDQRRKRELFGRSGVGEGTLFTVDMNSHV